MSRLTSSFRPPKMFTLVFVAAIVLCTAGNVFAISMGSVGGTWPKSWPKELEPFRKDAWTWEHGFTGDMSYDIAFTTREQFESAWPHILEVKSKGAPIVLMRGPAVRVFTDTSPAGGGGAGAVRPAKGKTAGVRIVVPHALVNAEATVPAKAPPAEGSPGISIVLVVDGEIIDLNRIPFPPDTPIIDQRML